MADELAERIAKALRPYEHPRYGASAHELARIAADVAREWMEGKAFYNGQLWTLHYDGPLALTHPHFADRFLLIPIDQEDT